jgi:hypothetical protein
MGNLRQDISKRLDELKQEIGSGDYLSKAISQREWGGADVIISAKLDEKILKWLGNQPSVVLSRQKTAPMRRAVITEFSKELSWLFCQLRDICSGQIDYISKYDFYGALAQAAIDHIENPGQRTEREFLLHAVLDQARKFHEK